ncbi:glucose-6-phosphate 1-epimerase [Chitinivorax tropicus]|uniref:Putative glucose-6-phosphate 1-epimerase n=1 Tax=Chitinivorax tropicus TaxID=714531 RepID=A0A840MN02_9PROT|nr:D-hexose-6-phosphate mutarotase [Chitinivorax tropicus]MBB5017886.1 glucose-6-phosphate 1-epimerase [Chitinivorax tropicus]
MNPSSLDALPYIKQTESADGLPLIEIDHPMFQALLTKQGAQLLQFQPRGGQPLLWMSSNAILKPGKSVRGGIPVCFPWFGPHPTQPQLPQHGFARTLPWRLEMAQADAMSMRFCFMLQDDEQTQALWPHRFQARLTFAFSVECELYFEVENLDTQPFELSYALHSYFPVKQIDQASISGLDQLNYLDKVSGSQRKLQAGPVVFAGEVDRIYLHTEQPMQIHEQGRPAINIESEGCRSTIVWNPGAEKCAQMADMPDAGYQQMVCVECGNAADNTLQLAPGERHRARMVIRAAG